MILMENSYPTAITPKYQTGKVNEEIPLYEGRMTLVRGSSAVDGRGQLTWVWQPDPIVRFEWRPDPAPIFHPLPGDYGVRINGYQDSTGILVGSWMEPDRALCIRGFLTGSLCEGQPDAKIEKLRFHVPNYHNYMGTPVAYQSGIGYPGRLTFLTEDWRITLDQAEGWGHPSNFEGLNGRTRLEAGNAISHVGLLERADGAPFQWADSKSVLEGFRLFLSFALGRWTAPILLVGTNTGGKEACQWEAARVDRCNDRYSWLPQYPYSVQPDMAMAWQGFSALAEAWSDRLAVCLEWYLQASRTDVPATGIVFAQAALELLFYLVIVEPATLRNVENKLVFSDTLRLLLHHCEIGSAIPSGLVNMTTVAKESHWVDGPHALNEVRNSIMHGSKVNKLIKSDTLVLNDIRQLGLWYIELILLYKMGYVGQIVDRRIGGNGRAIFPPWAKA
jgi:hypothetical protein